MDAESGWWVAELLAADCEKAWIHPGWEDTMQKEYEWLEEMKKERREGKDGRNAPTKGERTLIKSCGREVRVSCTKITKPTAWRRRSADPGN